MLLVKYGIIGFSEFYDTEIMETKFYSCTPPPPRLLYIAKLCIQLCLMTNVAMMDGGRVMQNPLLHIWLWSSDYLMLMFSV